MSAISKYLAAIGRRGGKSKSAAKTAAARKANAARWRKSEMGESTETQDAQRPSSPHCRESERGRH